MMKWCLTSFGGRRAPLRGLNRVVGLYQAKLGVTKRGVIILQGLEFRVKHLAFSGF